MLPTRSAGVTSPTAERSPPGRASTPAPPSFVSPRSSTPRPPTHGPLRPAEPARRGASARGPRNPPGACAAGGPRPPLAGKVVPLRTEAATSRNAYHLYVVRLVRNEGESLDQLATRRRALFIALRE